MNPFDSTTLPMLNVYVNDGHIIPPAALCALGPKLGASEFMEPALPGVAAFLQRHDRTAVQAAL